MQSLTDYLSTIFADAFTKAGYDQQYSEVLLCGQPELGQFQCNGALPTAKALAQNPRQIADQIIANIDQQSQKHFSKIDIAGPGFINITLTDTFLVDWVQQMSNDQRLGIAPVVTIRKVIVDYGGANVAKPLHVGHLRAGIIGESIKRIFRFMGDDVIGDVHLGDWGLQMGMVIIELAKRNPDWPYFDPNNLGPFPKDSPITISDLEEAYPAASARAKADPEVMEQARLATLELQNGRAGYRALWRHFVDVSITALKEDYGALGIEFDLWLGESDVDHRIPAMLNNLITKGIAIESQGALVIEIAQAGDKKPSPPLILKKSDGAVLYGTTDLATIEQRVEDLKAELILYVVDHRQRQHFEQVFRGAFISGIAPAHLGLEHNYFGTMNGPDGKPFKTREGGTMQLKDLIQLVNTSAMQRMSESNIANSYPESEKNVIARLVGLAALKYADLMNQRTKDYIFDIERFSSFEGRTGPYLLYTTVRARSILAKAKEHGFNIGQLALPKTDQERKLLLQLALLPNALKLAYNTRMPNHLADYVYNLANEFSRFYSTCNIIKETDPAQQAAWLRLTWFYEKVATQVLNLLTIDVPERM